MGVCWVYWPLSVEQGCASLHYSFLLTLSSPTNPTQAKRRTRYDPLSALRINDEVLTVAVHVFWPCTNELESETRDACDGDHVKFGIREIR